MFVTTFSFQAFTCSIRLDTKIIFIWNFKSTLKMWLKETLCYKKNFWHIQQRKSLQKIKVFDFFRPPAPSEFEFQINVLSQVVYGSICGESLRVFNDVWFCMRHNVLGERCWFPIPFILDSIIHSSINEWNWAHKRFESIAKKTVQFPLFFAIVSNSCQ